MELGATVCLPNTVPNCPVCPLSAHCLGLKNKTAAALPNKSPKKPRRIEQKTVVLFCKGGKVLLQKRPPKGLLAGLWEFMMFDDFLQPEELPRLLRIKKA